MSRRKTAQTSRSRRPTRVARIGLASLQGASGPPPAAADADPTEPQALVVSHWFDSGSAGPPYVATVRLTGRRVGIQGPTKAGDTFVRDEVIRDVIPNTGRISLTTWVYGLNDGEWTVSAELDRGPGSALPSGLAARRRVRAELIPRAAWSWRRWALSTVPDAPVRTRWALTAPLARLPAVLPGSWTILGVIGVLLAVVIQSVILAGRGVPIDRSLLTSGVAILAGLATANIWFAVLAPGPWYRSLAGGWAVDGFLVAAPIAAISVLLAQGLPVGVFLDASAPGIFVAVTIGRMGCFITGCCAGRITSGRVGIWSSDRRVGALRVPSQLIESGAGLLIAIVSTAGIVLRPPLPDGLIFIATFAAYAVVRQLVLRTRSEARSFSWRRSAAPALPGS